MAWRKHDDKEVVIPKSKGGTRRIGDAPKFCPHPQHEPAKLYVYQPGVYEHTCPACGQTVTFTVPHVGL